MVEIILIFPLLHRWMLRQHPGPSLACQQAATFRLPAAQWERWLMDCPILPRGAGITFLQSFKGTRDYWEVQHEEMVALAMAIQRCAVHSRMPPGMLCRAVQELHRCLAPMIESGDQVDLKMLDVARRDPVAPTSTERTQRAEQLISVPAPSNPPTFWARGGCTAQGVGPGT